MRTSSYEFDCIRIHIYLLCAQRIEMMTEEDRGDLSQRDMQVCVFDVACCDI